MEKLALVMPAYNEADCIEAVVDSWLKIFEKVSGTMIVVNDGSRDATPQILDRLAKSRKHLRVVHQPNAGHGAAVVRGYETAIAEGYDWVFQTDSDDQFDTGDFWKVWEARQGAPFVLGVRAERHDPRGRKLISRVAAWLMMGLFGVLPRDANCPFRLLRTPLLRGILDVLPRGLFAPNIFITLVAKIARVPMVELPVEHRERQTGTVSILRWNLLKVCLRSAEELLRFRMDLGMRHAQVEGLPALGAPPPEAPPKKAMASALKKTPKLRANGKSSGTLKGKTKKKKRSA